MTGLQRVQVFRKLIDELRDNQSNPILNIGYNIGLTNHDNPFKWRVTLFGPRDTPYNGGIFFLTLIFSDASLLYKEEKKLRTESQLYAVLYKKNKKLMN
jgi:hypothetical protein